MGSEQPGESRSSPCWVPAPLPSPAPSSFPLFCCFLGQPLTPFAPVGLLLVTSKFGAWKTFPSLRGRDTLTAEATQQGLTFPGLIIARFVSPRAPRSRRRGLHTWRGEQGGMGSGKLAAPSFRCSQEREKPPRRRFPVQKCLEVELSSTKSSLKGVGPSGEDLLHLWIPTGVMCWFPPGSVPELSAPSTTPPAAVSHRGA